MPLEVDASIEYTFPEHHDVITRREPGDRLTLQHLPPHGPAADADREPRQGVARRGLRTGQERLPVLRGKARRTLGVREHAEEHNANVERYLK